MSGPEHTLRGIARLGAPDAAKILEREPQPKVRALVVDAGGVLHPSKQRFTIAGLATIYGVDVAHMAESWKRVYRGLRNGTVDDEQFKDLLTKSVGKKPTGPVSILCGYEGEGGYEVYPQVLDMLEQVKKKGVDLALLTNTWPSLAAMHEEHGTFDLFEPDRRFYSHKIGDGKPSENAYRIVLDRLGFGPAQVGFVDDRERNAEVANGIGMIGVTFTTPDQLAVDLREKMGLAVTLPPLKG